MMSDPKAEALVAQSIFDKNTEVIGRILKKIDDAVADPSSNLGDAVIVAVNSAFQLGAIAGMREVHAALRELAKEGIVGLQRDNPKPEMN